MTSNLAGHISIMSLVSSSKLKRASSRDGELHGDCPFCGGTDRFIVWEATNEWSCRQCVGANVPRKDAIEYVKRRDNCTFQDACAKLGITIEGKIPVRNSERKYSGLEDYATEKGVPVSVFSDAGWKEGSHKGRAGLIYPTYRLVNGEVKTIERIRFIDGDADKAKYMPLGDGDNAMMAWYGLKSALDMVQSDDSLPLILVNGEASERVAKYFKLPAFCKTGGENNIPADLLAELKEMVGSQRPIIIALDCDKHGAMVALKIEAQLKNIGMIASVIDLGLGDKGDCADFCKLYSDESYAELQTRYVRASVSKPTTAGEAADFIVQMSTGVIDPLINGRTIVNPYKIYHGLGGMAKYMPAGLMTLLIAMSGGGKTAWMEYIAEALAADGLGTVWFGNEFTPAQYHMRRIQRLSGQNVYDIETDTHKVYAPISWTEMLGFGVWLEENKLKTPDFMRKSPKQCPLSKAQLETIQWSSRLVNNWRGKIKYIAHNPFIEDALLDMTTHVLAERASGRSVELAVFDYLQMYHLKENSSGLNDHEAMLYKIRDWAVANQVHAIVASQINKDGANDQQEHDKLLTVKDAKFITDASANLVITLNTRYELGKEGRMVKRQMVVNNRTMYYGAANVVKNTGGELGAINQIADFEKLSWLNSGYTIEKLPMGNTKDE